MKQLEMNQKTFERLKTAYEAARQQGLDSFVFEDNEFVTNYAKYLIEYIEMKLGENK